MAEPNPGVREVAVLHQATQMILSGSMDLDTLLHEVLLVVRNFFGVSNCAVFLADAAAGHVCCRVQNGYDPKFRGTRFRIGKEGVVGWVAYSRMPLYVPDVSQEPRYVCADPRIRSELALPLQVRDELLGVLDVESDQLDFFDEQTIGLLAMFAGQAAIAVDNARLYSTERRRMRQIELINLIARSAAAASQVEQFLGTLAELISDSFEGTNVAVFLCQADGSVRLGARAGSVEPLIARFALSQRTGTLGDALSKRQLAAAPQLSPERPGCFGDGGSELAVPLLAASDLRGAIVIGHEHEKFFSMDDRAIAQAAADVAATAMQNVFLADELRRVANTDFLTGLYNQRYFYCVVAQEVARAKRYNKRFALAMLDIREFRDVNAALGFDGADELLRRVARALTASMRRNDTVCRFAGDRFALVLPETDPERMEAVLGKIRGSLGEVQYHAAGKPRRLAAAYAVAHFPQDGATDMELIRTLQERLRQVKDQASAAGA